MRKLTEDSLSIEFSDVDRANAEVGERSTSTNFMNQDEYLVKLGRNWGIEKHCRLNNGSQSASRQVASGAWIDHEFVSCGPRFALVCHRKKEDGIKMGLGHEVKLRHEKTNEGTLSRNVTGKFQT